MRLHFYKYHGLGNDYIIINIDENKLPNNKKIKSNLARRLCIRHFSVGADGILFAIPPDSNKYDYIMEIFNPDGSEAEMCGNGIRMFSKYLYTHGLLSKKIQKIKTKAGIIIPELIFENEIIKGIKVDMGIPKLLRSEIPMIGKSDEKVINEEFKINNYIFRITCVNMGNPHCVIFVDNVNDFDISIGKKIEYAKEFPERTNVEFVQILDKNNAKVRVWERGVGETLACGTGACATAVAGILNKKLNNKVNIKLKGGELLIEWKDNKHVYMTGPAEEVFEGNINIDLNKL